MQPPYHHSFLLEKEANDQLGAIYHGGCKQQHRKIERSARERKKLKSKKESTHADKGWQAEEKETLCARVANIVEDTNHHQQWSHKSHFKKNYVGKRAQRKALVVISGQALSPERAPVLHNCSSSSPILQSSPTFTDNNCSSTAKCDHQSRQKKKNPSKKRRRNKIKRATSTAAANFEQYVNRQWADF